MIGGDDDARDLGSPQGLDLFRQCEAADPAIEVIVDQENVWGVFAVGSQTDGGLAITCRDRIASPTHQQCLIPERTAGSFSMARAAHQAISGWGVTNSVADIREASPIGTDIAKTLPRPGHERNDRR